MANRDLGVGPFTAGKCQVHGCVPGVYDGAAVFDAVGNVFCLVDPDHCVGGDIPAAKARAQRIAESLNRTEQPITIDEVRKNAGLGDDWGRPPE